LSKIHTAKQEIATKIESLILEEIIGEDVVLSREEQDGKCEDMRININAYMKEGNNSLMAFQRTKLSTLLRRRQMAKNEELGLPFGDGMEKVAICFDVDGTLIDEEIEHHSTLALLRLLGLQKWKNVDVIVWSGGGKEYAETIGRRLSFANVKYHSKLEHPELRKKYDKIIAIDDIQDTRLGDINLIVRNKNDYLTKPNAS
jgi:hypothetical protein